MVVISIQFSNILIIQFVVHWAVTMMLFCLFIFKFILDASYFNFYHHYASHFLLCIFGIYPTLCF